MSIPPLVCNTPPPPDQCDDDKDDVEGFDLRYNLSQEDDDDDYDYEKQYSSYSSSIIVSDNINNSEKPIENLNHDNSEHANNISNETPFSLKIPIIAEDVSIQVCTALEDLNLKIENEVVIPDTISESERTVSECQDVCTDSINKSKNEDLEEVVRIDNDRILHISSPAVLRDDNECLGLETDLPDTNAPSSATDANIFEKKLNTELQETVNNSVSGNTSAIAEDNFDDFEDFQFSHHTDTEKLDDNFNNPWQDDSNDTPNFSEFQADFDNEKLQSPSKTLEGNVDNTQHSTEEIGDLDDDFGDFDDFRSSKDTNSEADPIPSAINIINFHSNETQILESIDKILLSVFTEEIPEPEEAVHSNLLTVASATWHHLKEVDIRQPYIINWNTSLGQKSLLKALCIDSRNILFVPKWNSSTPKYAANVSVSPLQPQKPIHNHTTATTSNTPQTETTNQDQVTSKESWMDPFNSNGHESSSKEGEKATSEIKTIVNELENTVSVINLNKIHSSTLSVQPLRQINLPDTHIFTPVDSEEPRSKTIHYGDGPVLIPNKKIESNKDSIPQNPETKQDEDDWEFQNFKGASGSSMPVCETSVEKSSQDTDVRQIQEGITYQTQILQPVKVEPVIPKLNWPDPGEVKETFDDFTHFANSTAWNEETENRPQISNTKPTENKDVIHSITNVDDEFDNFQTAPNLSNSIVSSTLTDKIQANKTELQINSIKTEATDISKKPVNSYLNTNKYKDSMNLSSNLTIHSNILQPINAASSATNLYTQKSGQILQPLSLEGYSQINWPQPGVDLQDLSCFNPLESLQSLKSNSGSSGTSKVATPEHIKSNSIHNDMSDDDVWGEFVSSQPHQTPQKKVAAGDEDEWTDFVSNSSVQQKTLNTISFNVQSNLSVQKASNHSISAKSSQIPIEIPTLNYITPKSSNHGVFIDKHFQNL
ncbi:unnamed protein product [Leptidea sinapis]|uniref:Aftiphilin clathrin-binding box domain-containing protein n=1 Tax=Leptidea sinapis TaxID=189913 RepID=A0A5E4Q1J4_9NEOP|nr:unnamed protein product [Leptidea sinapis]